MSTISRVTQLLRTQFSLRFCFLLLEVEYSVESAHGSQLSSLRGTAVKTPTIIVVALANDFAATDDDATMTVMQRRLSSLMEAERQMIIGAWRHFLRGMDGESHEGLMEALDLLCWKSNGMIGAFRFLTTSTSDGLERKRV